MKFKSGNLTATTTAAPLVAAAGTSVRRVLIKNRGSEDFLVGDSTSQDVNVEPGTSYEIATETGDDFDLSTIYVKASASTVLIGWNGQNRNNA